MPAIPPNLQARFEECLRNKAIPIYLHGVPMPLSRFI